MNPRSKRKSHTPVAAPGLTQIALEDGLGAPGQVVLVLQGGGALGAYQAGVYEALHEAGIEPDWVIGTSIGAINGAIIAGNPPADRLERLREFWQLVELRAHDVNPTAWFSAGNLWANMRTFVSGIPGFFAPNPAAWSGSSAKVGLERASYYSTTPLKRTLEELVQFGELGGENTRLTVGAVNVRSGAMHYFDTRDHPLHVDHVLASGALPPAFPAVRIDGEAYWDGGIYSNTPIEAVLDDRPRRDSLIFAVNVWHQQGPEPTSIAEVMSRHKDIQFASRADSHIRRQKQIHRLRHVIRELNELVPNAARNERARELASWGCRTRMHIAHLLAPRVEGEDASKDIDFTPAGLNARWRAGYENTARMLSQAPWQHPADPLEGIVEHVCSSGVPSMEVASG